MVLGNNFSVFSTCFEILFRAGIIGIMITFGYLEKVEGWTDFLETTENTFSWLSAATFPDSAEAFSDFTASFSTFPDSKTTFLRYEAERFLEKEAGWLSRLEGVVEKRTSITYVDAILIGGKFKVIDLGWSEWQLESKEVGRMKSCGLIKRGI